MLTTTDDLRVKEIRELSTPDQVMREIPRTLTATRTVAASRNAIHAVLTGAVTIWGGSLLLASHVPLRINLRARSCSDTPDP